MASLTLQIMTDLTTVDCGVCGGTYAINERYRKQKAQEGGGWHCPYCECSWGFFDDYENAKLRRQLEQERKRKEWAQQEAKNAENKRRAAVGQVTKIKRRVSKGVCPCCNRTFKDLAAHMETKHPSWTEEK